MLSDDNAIIAARQPPRRSLVAFARRENAKLKAYASLTWDSRATADDTIVHWWWHSTQQSPAARDRTRPTLQPAVSAFFEARR